MSDGTSQPNPYGRAAGDRNDSLSRGAGALSNYCAEKEKEELRKEIGARFADFWVGGGG